jgi:hypothetical protein
MSVAPGEDGGGDDATLLDEAGALLDVTGFDTDVDV